MASSEIVLRLKMWGVRGSIPTPLTDEEVRYKQARLLEHVLQEIRTAGTVEKVFGKEQDVNALLNYLNQLGLPLAGTFGGNTSCFEIQAIESPLCVVDAGSGIRLLGEALLKRFFEGKTLNPLSLRESAKKEVNLFLTHYHWDHIQGFPFFPLAFMRGLEIKFYGKNSSTVQLDDVLRGQQASHYFPVSWKDLPCVKGCYELPRFNPQALQLGEVIVTYSELDHPGGSFGYAFEARGKKVAIVGDSEHREIPPPNTMQLSKNASAIYWDAQYLPEEYRGEVGMSRYGWGHGTYEYGIKCALDSNVCCVILGHHEPNRNDFKMKDMEKRACAFRDEQLRLSKYKGKKLELFLAQEGAIVEVFADGAIRFVSASGKEKMHLP